MVNRNAYHPVRYADQSHQFSTSAEQISHVLVCDREYADADILRFATFFRNNPIPMLVFHPDGSLIKTNPAAERFLKQIRCCPEELLPGDHAHIVQACLAGKQHDCTREITINSSILKLHYHPRKSFNIVDLYLIDRTNYRKVEENLRQLDSHNLALAKMAASQSQHTLTKHMSYKHAIAKAAAAQWQNALSDLFVAMDGCVFSSDDFITTMDLI
jgi:hypothetical protein